MIYSIVGGKCYQIFSENLNWTSARDSCRSKGPGADLISIHTSQLQGRTTLPTPVTQRLMTLLSPIACHSAYLTSQLYIFQTNAWIGLSDRYWNNHFWWSNNDIVDFTNWMVDEPNIRTAVCLSVCPSTVGSSCSCVDLSIAERMCGDGSTQKISWQVERC